MRFLLLLAGLVTLPRTALAQDVEPREPQFWLSLSTGYLRLQSVVDGNTTSAWQFGNAWPLRLSFEKSLNRSASIGVTALWMRAPLTYRAPGLCGVCNAHATAAYYGPVFRMGRGETFYQLLEISAGVMQYGSFTDDESGLRLPPARANRDVALGLGVGLGYSLRRDWDLEFVASQIHAYHERDNLPGGTDTLAQHALYRLALRVGY